MLSFCPAQGVGVSPQWRPVDVGIWKRSPVADRNGELEVHSTAGDSSHRAAAELRYDAKLVHFGNKALRLFGVFGIVKRRSNFRPGDAVSEACFVHDRG